jgi:hypothetical protein
MTLSWFRRSVILNAVCTIVLLARPSDAADPTAPAQPPKGASVNSAIAQTSLQTIATQARSFAAASSRARTSASSTASPSGVATFVLLPIKSDRTPREAGKLEERLAALLAAPTHLLPSVPGAPTTDGAGAASPSFQVHRAASMAEALTSGFAEEHRFVVEARVTFGVLQLVVSHQQVTRNIWDRTRKKMNAVLHGNTFLQERFDPELQSFFPPAPLEALRLHKATTPITEPILALACGDLDGDLGNELAVLTAEHVLRGRIKAGTFVEESRRRLRDVANHVPVPFREPLGRLALSQRHLLLWHSSYQPVQINSEFALQSALTGLVFAGGPTPICMKSAPVEAAADFRTGAPCFPPQATALTASPSETTNVLKKRAEEAHEWIDAGDAVALGTQAWSAVRLRDNGHIVVRRDGRILKELSLKETAKVKNGESASVSATFGSQLALADLDLDGRLELITSLAPAVPSVVLLKEDAVVVSALHENDAGSVELKERARFRVADSVRAIAVCPLEAHATQTIVAATTHDLMLIH